jgi:HK97 family phage major capsid protein
MKTKPSGAGQEVRTLPNGDVELTVFDAQGRVLSQRRGKSSEILGDRSARAVMSQRRSTLKGGGTVKTETAPPPASPARVTTESPIRVKVGSEPLTYGPGSHFSFFRDLLAVNPKIGAPDKELAREANRRLGRNQAEATMHMMARREAFALSDHEQRALTRTDGAGGFFVGPAWLLDQVAGLSRDARVTADLIGSRPLPPGTDQVQIPLITGGGPTAATQQDGGAVQSTDAIDSFVSLPVRTIAGLQDVALPMIEQSGQPAVLDEILFGQLLDSYNAVLEAQILNGSGAAGQLTGILNVAGIGVVTYTDATPTGAEIAPKIAQAVNTVDEARKRLAQALIMAGRRFNWLNAAVDASGRPFVTPNPSFAAFNPAFVTREVSPQDIAGQVAGRPTFISTGVPINLGGGVNEDRIIVFRPADCRLYEGLANQRLMLEVLSGTMQARLIFHRYVAFTAARYPVGVCVVSGTGLATPVF